MTRDVGAVAALLLAVSLLLVLEAAWHRRRRLRRERRREQQLQEIRPVLVAVVTDDREAGLAVDDLPGTAGTLVDEAAMEMLSKLRGAAHDQLAALLVRHGVVTAARRSLNSSRPDVRARAALLLGAVRDRASVGAVAWLLDDPVPDVARAATRALGRQGDPRTVPLLLATLDGPRPLPVGLVSTALINIGPEAIDALIVGLGTARPTGRAAAAEVLGRLRALKATDALVGALLHDTDREVRRRSANALGWIGAPKAAPALTELMVSTDDGVLRAICAWSLGEVGGPAAVPVLTAMLEKPQHALASNAAEALVALGAIGISALQGAAQGHSRGAPYAREALAIEKLRAERAWRGVPT